MLLSLLARYYKSRSRLRRIGRSLRVRPSALTLDIGSGDSPFPAADVICDKFPWDDRERTAHLLRDRPLVAGDIEALPFKDKAFDFVHCSHVLEHTQHPDRAIQELMRVGKAGYIEVPSAYHEKTVRSYPGHLWFIALEQGQLMFSPKPRGILDEDIIRTSFDGLLDRDPLFSAFYYAHLYDLFHIEYFWEGTIHYALRGTADLGGGFDKGSVDWSHAEAKPARDAGIAQVVKRWMRWRAARAKTFRIEDLLACPRCRGGLLKNDQSWSCAACGARYAIRDNIPVLLADVG